MQYFELKKSATKVSVLALGTWAFGGGDYWGNVKDDNASLDTIDAALDIGINLFDSADSYNDGESDKVLGKAMRGRRDRFVVSTKVYLDKLHAPDVIAVCENSLRRMGTDYLDVFSPHFASKEIPFDETFGAMRKLRDQGKIRGIGLSNFGVQAMDAVAKAGFMDDIEMQQLPYSLLLRAIEYGIQQKCESYHLPIVCYSPLAQGLLTGKYESAADAPQNLKVLRFFDSKGEGHGEPGCEQQVFPAIAMLKQLCKDVGVALAPAAIAWLYGRPGIRAVLTGASSVSELTENMKALDLSLSPEFANQMTAATEDVKACIGGNADMWSSTENSRIY